MAIGSITSGTQAATQQGFQQLRLQQARRDAEQAEQTARSLSAQANQAQRQADQAQETARTITVQADQAQGDAGRARQGLASVQSVSQMGAQISRVAEQTVEKIQSGTSVQSSTTAPASTTSSSASTSTSVKPPAVINTQGQVTGTLINVTA